MANGEPRKSIGILGLGAAACVACCAGPIIGLLAAAGLLAVAAYVIAGVVGLAVAIPSAVWLIHRRRSAAGCEPVTAAVPVELGTRRTP